VRLLLDEMWTPTIALELRKREFDAIAISEPAYAGRYAGISDDQVFARAHPPTVPGATGHTSCGDRRQQGYTKELAYGSPRRRGARGGRFITYATVIYDGFMMWVWSRFRALAVPRRAQ
jgi:hypothetical protein